jgi:hypothetical protein
MTDDTYERELEADINEECAKIGEVAKARLSVHLWSCCVFQD